MVKSSEAKMKNSINEIINDSTWKKTSQFIEDKYGKKIEYRFLSGSDSSLNSSEQAYYVWGDDLVVPLKYKNTQLGNVIVSRGATLNYDQQTETVDLIQFLIEPQIYNRVLKLQLNSLMRPESSTDDNVIELFSKQPKSGDVYVIDDDVKTRKLVSKFIHIRSKSEQTRHKVAMKIHEMVGTIVLLRLQDIYDGREVLSKAEVDAMNLSDTALYIDNILNLNKNQIDVLSQLSKRKENGNFVIMVGSSLNENQIKHLEYNNDFKNDLIGLSYDVDRVPLFQQTSDEVLDLLFFNDGDTIS